MALLWAAEIRQGSHDLADFSEEAVCGDGGFQDDGEVGRNHLGDLIEGEDG